MGKEKCIGGKKPGGGNEWGNKRKAIENNDSLLKEKMNKLKSRMKIKGKFIKTCRKE